MNLEERLQEYCEANCADDDCLNCQLHQFMELRRAGRCRSTKPTAVFKSEGDNVSSFRSLTSSASFSQSLSLERTAQTSPGKYALAPLEKKIYEAFQQTSSADGLENLQVHGRKMIVNFAPSLSRNHFETAVTAAIRVLATFVAITEVEIHVGNTTLKTTTSRIERLLGREAIVKISENWNVLWSYLKATKQDPDVLEKVFQYLSGLDNNAPDLLKSSFSG